MSKAKEQQVPLVVGKKYWVECVNANTLSEKDPVWMPIFGTIHADEKIIAGNNADKLHIHIDMRFITPHERKLLSAYFEWMTFAIYIKYNHKPAYINQLPHKCNYHLCDINKKCDIPDPAIHIPMSWEYRKCLTQWNVISIKKEADYLKELKILREFKDEIKQERKNRIDNFESKYNKCIVDMDNPVCPHQKFNLSTVEPTIINGKQVIVCPGHKLKWCAESGKIVKSFAENNS
jgi:hypothetical protein